MQREDITREVLTVLADFVDEPDATPAAEGLGLDSFSRLCVLAELEGHFDVMLGDDDIADIESVDQLIDVFSAAIAQAAAPYVAAPVGLVAATGGA